MNASTLAFESAATRASDAARYAFILAASHSGSTLLSLLLNSHPDVATVGELSSGAVRRIELYRCSCRELIRECSFWKKVRDVVLPHHPGFDLATFGIRFEPSRPAWVRRLARIEHRGKALELARDLALERSGEWRRILKDSSRGCEALARAVLQVTGARMVVDSSKLAHRLKYLLRIPSLDVKVVHLVRDGRAVALTYMDEDRFADAQDPSLRRGGWGSRATWLPQQLPMPRAADEWRRDLRAAEHALATMDRSRWMRVRYEDLCRTPADTLGRIFTFLGLDPTKAVSEFRAIPHHIVGNGMRLDSTSEIRLDDRWRTVLDRQHLREFDAVGGRLNRRFGYE